MNEPRSSLDVREDEHDRHHHTYTVIVNGRRREVRDDVLTFREVVALAFDHPPAGDNVIFTVTYSRAAGPRPAGTLTEGHEVTIKDGTVFNVTATDKS